MLFRKKFTPIIGENRIRESDVLFLYGVPRDDDVITYTLFMESFHPMGYRNGAMQCSSEDMTAEEFQQLMKRHRFDLIKYGTEVVFNNQPGDLMEMLEWCRDNVTGWFSGWCVDYINPYNDQMWNPGTQLRFFFKKKDHAMLFKLTFGC